GEQILVAVWLADQPLRPVRDGGAIRQAGLNSGARVRIALARFPAQIGRIGKDDIIAQVALPPGLATLRIEVEHTLEGSRVRLVRESVNGTKCLEIARRQIGALPDRLAGWHRFYGD